MFEYSKAVLLTLMGCLITGCTLVHPHVSLGELEHGTRRAAGINPDVHSSVALAYAKRARDRFDASRKAILSTEAGTLLALIPMAGYVGYSAARGHAGSNVGRVSALGLTGLTLSQMLVQHGRVQVFTEASAKITCSIGVYRLAVASAGLATAEIAGIRSDLRDIRGSHSKTPDDDATSIFRMETRDLIEEIEQLLADHTQAPIVDAMLVNAVEKIVNAADKELDATLPQIADAARFVVPLRINPPKPDPASLVSTSASAPEPFHSLNQRLERLRALILALPSNEQATPDFSACTYSPTNVTFVAAPTPLMLGPGDSDHKSTKTLKKGTAITVSVSGGKPEYVVGVSGGAGAKITVTKGASGGSTLFEVASAADTPVGSYVMTVVDATGIRKELVLSVVD